MPKTVTQRQEGARALGGDVLEFERACLILRGTPGRWWEGKIPL